MMELVAFEYVTWAIETTPWFEVIGVVPVMVTVWAGTLMASYVAPVAETTVVAPPASNPTVSVMVTFVEARGATTLIPAPVLMVPAEGLVSVTCPKALAV